MSPTRCLGSELSFRTRDENKMTYECRILVVFSCDICCAIFEKDYYTRKYVINKWSFDAIWKVI